MIGLSPLSTSHPRIFQHSLDLANAEKEESVFVGDDWVADAKGASSFGLEVIFFDVFKEHTSENGMKIVHHLKEIKEIL